MLRDAAQAYFDGRQPDGVVDGRVELWRWNAEKRRCEVRTGTPEDAARAMAARWASNASLGLFGNREIRLLCLAALLDDAAYTNGLDKPLDERSRTIAKQYAPKVLDETLAYAMAQHHPAAAAAAARLLGEIGKADELLYQGDKLAPLVRAVQSPDRRLRMAALEAIVKLRPTKPFPAPATCRRRWVSSRPAAECAMPGRRPEHRADATWRNARHGRLRDRYRHNRQGCCDWPRGRPTTSWPGSTFRSTTRNRRSCKIAATGGRRRCAWVGGPLRVFRTGGRSGPARSMAKTFARPHDEQAFRWQLEQLATLRPQELSTSTHGSGRRPNRLICWPNAANHQASSTTCTRTRLGARRAV